MRGPGRRYCHLTSSKTGLRLATWYFGRKTWPIPSASILVARFFMECEAHSNLVRLNFQSTDPSSSRQPHKWWLPLPRRRQNWNARLVSWASWCAGSFECARSNPPPHYALVVHRRIVDATCQGHLTHLLIHEPMLSGGRRNGWISPLHRYQSVINALADDQPLPADRFAPNIKKGVGCDFCRCNPIIPFP